MGRGDVRCGSYGTGGLEFDFLGQKWYHINTKPATHPFHKARGSRKTEEGPQMAGWAAYMSARWEQSCRGAVGMGRVLSSHHEIGGRQMGKGKCRVANATNNRDPVSGVGDACIFDSVEGAMIGMKTWCASAR